MTKSEDSSESPDPLPAGFSLGRYVILEELAPAEMGRVYKARDAILGETVAINILAPSLRDDATRYKFMMRARMAAETRPDTVRALGMDRGVPYVVVTYLEGVGAAVDIGRM